MNKTNFKFSVFLLLFSIFAYYMHFTNESAKNYEVFVLAKNKVYQRPLDNKLKVEGSIGLSEIEWNDLGQVRFLNSACPNKICVNMGWAKGIPLICVPNGIIVRPSKMIYDAISR